MRVLSSHEKLAEPLALNPRKERLALPSGKERLALPPGKERLSLPAGRGETQSKAPARSEPKVKPKAEKAKAKTFFFSKARKAKPSGWARAGKGALIAGGLGLGAYGLSRATSNGNNEKKSHLEVLNEMAFERANDLLELANEGYEVTFDKVASYSEDDVDQVITELAWSILEDEGYA